MQHFKPLLIDQLTDAGVGYHTLRGGQRMRYALLWPRKECIGTILVAPGRREFIEKKYLEMGHEFLERGYRLIFFEWRGQGLSDRFLSGTLRQRDTITDFALHMEDLDSLFEHIVQPNITGPLILVGHSMGAHLFVRWLMRREAPPVAKVILTGPMLALAGHMTHGVANLISWGASKLGHGKDYAAAQHDYNAQDRAFPNNPLTNDPARFTIIEKYFDAFPDMTVGGVTWDWLHAAMRSMHIVQRRHNLDRLKMPFLIITGGKDRVTSPDENARYIHALPSANATLIDGGLHDILNEADARRSAVWQCIDQFL